VGVVAKNRTGFTVQTLKRNYEDNDDKTIRNAVGAIKWLSIAGGVPAIGQLTNALANLAVFINQHHFLSGRRAFRVDWGKEFDYTDDRVVFETVALERFTNQVFAKSTVAMGDDKTIIRRVWVGMLNRFAKVHGFTVINEAPRSGWKVETGVHYIQQNVAYNQGAAIAAHPQYPNMSEEHTDLLPAR
jgi:hypothetical protein